MHAKALKKKLALTLLAMVMVFSVFYMKPVTVHASNYDRWMTVCSTMLRNLKAHGFRYSNSGTKGTYRAGLSSGKKCNCALYVSWCLQEYGATSPGNRFYVKSGGGLHKNFSWKSTVSVIKVYKKCSSVNLLPGDVVCWSGGTAHANIYAGSSKGVRYWYDGGKVATSSNSNGSRYVHTGARHLGYLDGRKISYIIRIRDLNQ